MRFPATFITESNSSCCNSRQLKNLKYNFNGSLDIYLQADSPKSDKESNWLPITKGESTVTFRVYLPQQSLLNNQYKLPLIETVE